MTAEGTRAEAHHDRDEVPTDRPSLEAFGHSSSVTPNRSYAYRVLLARRLEVAGHLPWVAIRAALVTALVAVVVFLSAWGRLPVSLSVLTALGAGFCAVVAASRWPGVALAVLIASIPFSTMVLAFLYRLGAPYAIVRPLGSVKEVVTAGLLVAMLRRLREDRWDALDGLAIAFLGILTVELALPYVLPDAFPVKSLSEMLLGWRENALFVALFLGARHAGIARVWLHRYVVVVVVACAVLCAGAFWEWLDASGYERFFVNTIGIRQYHLNVLHDNPFAPNTILVYGTLAGHRITRVGSFLLDQLSLGFYLILAVALGSSRLLRRGAAPWTLGLLAASLVSLILTLTRSAILGGAVAGLLILHLGMRTSAAGRVRLALMAMVGVLAAIPFASKQQLLSRTGAAFNGTDTSTEGHIQRTTDAVHYLMAHPLGSGLGTGGGVGVRNRAGGVIAENAYIQLGTIAGVAAMVVFVVLVVVLLRALYRRAMVAGADNWYLIAVFAAGVGLSVAGLFLQVWYSLPITLTFWGLAGVCLSARPREKPSILPARAWSRPNELMVTTR